MSVEDELAYTMENLGLDPAVMRRRVEDALDLLGLHDLRYRPLGTLSGGQQQRVAIGAVLTASPRVLVLDEPTSALDPAAAEEVLASLTRLVHDLGLTVLLAEHRLERVLPFADSVVLVPGAGRPAHGGAGGRGHGRRRRSPHRWSSSAASPAGTRCRCRSGTPGDWSGPLRDRLVGCRTATRRPRARGPGGGPARPGDRAVRRRHRPRRLSTSSSGRARSSPSWDGTARASRRCSASWPACAPRRRDGWRWRARIPPALAPRDLVARVGLVPQDAGLLLYGDSVAAECPGADHDTGLDPGTTAAVLERILPGLPPDRHPRDLSEGQRLALALAVVLAPAPPLLLLDEPTRGLDYPGKARLVTILDELAAAGHAVVMATHDVELVARVATRASCWPRARSWPTDRRGTWCASRRSSPPRWPRCWRPTRG